jgi:hypothetical protein
MSTLEQLKKLRAELKRSAKRRERDETIKEVDKRRKGRGGKGYKDSTYLLIKGLADDVGVRPFPAGTRYWNSPHVELYDGTQLLATNQLQAGRNYTVEVTVSNLGDLQAPSCSVDLFLCEPSLGFNVAAGTLLGVHYADVASHGTTKVLFSFTAKPEHVGHRCLFARAYSISTQDVMVSAATLDTAGDRHIGQQNLTIIKQARPMTLLINPPARGKFTVGVRRINGALPELRAFKGLAELRGSTKGARATFGLLALADAHMKGARLTALLDRVVAAQAPTPARATAPVPRDHRPAQDPVTPIRAAALNRWEFANGGTSFLNRRSILMVPDLGLRAGEAAVYHVELNDADGRTRGGITLVVTG